MGVNCDGLRPRIERKCVRFFAQQIVDELLEEKTTFRDRFAVVEFQLTIIVDEHRVTRGFEEDDGRSRVREQRDVMRAELRRVIEIALTERRTAAAFAVFR